MKKNKKALLTSIILLPFLMSNSPSVTPSYDYYYESVVVSCVHDGTFLPADDVTPKERYTVVIENQGDEYPRVFGGFSLNRHYAECTVRDTLFRREVVPLGVTKTYIFVSDYVLPLNGENEEWAFHALNIKDENVTFSDYSIGEYSERAFQINCTIDGMGDYEYAAIVDVTYKGTPYAFETEISSSGTLEKIRTTEELELSELTIDSIKAYRSRENRYNFFREVGTGLLAGFSRMMADPIFWGYLALAFLPPVLITTGIVLLVHFVVRSDKAKKNKDK